MDKAFCFDVRRLKFCRLYAKTLVARLVVMRWSSPQSPQDIDRLPQRTYPAFIWGLMGTLAFNMWGAVQVAKVDIESDLNIEGFTVTISLLSVYCMCVLLLVHFVPFYKAPVQWALASVVSGTIGASIISVAQYPSMLAAGSAIYAIPAAASMSLSVSELELAIKEGAVVDYNVTYISIQCAHQLVAGVVVRLVAYLLSSYGVSWRVLWWMYAIAFALFGIVSALAYWCRDNVWFSIYTGMSRVVGIDRASITYIVGRPGAVWVLGVTLFASAGYIWVIFSIDDDFMALYAIMTPVALVLVGIVAYISMMYGIEHTPQLFVFAASGATLCAITSVVLDQVTDVTVAVVAASTISLCCCAILYPFSSTMHRILKFKDTPEIVSSSIAIFWSVSIISGELIAAPVASIMKGNNQTSAAHMVLLAITICYLMCSIRWAKAIIALPDAPIMPKL